MNRSRLVNKIETLIGTIIGRAIPLIITVTTIIITATVINPLPAP